MIELMRTLRSDIRDLCDQLEADDEAPEPKSDTLVDRIVKGLAQGIGWLTVYVMCAWAAHWLMPEVEFKILQALLVCATGI